MNLAQSGLFTGTSTPFEHLRPGSVRRFAASASAKALFSTASHFPNTLAKGSVAMFGSLAQGTSAGLSLCAANITFEAGYKVPFISCERFAGAGGAGVVTAAPGA